MEKEAMSENVTQKHLDAINAALPDGITNLEMIALVICILKGYDCTDEEIAHVGHSLIKFKDLVKETDDAEG